MTTQPDVTLTQSFLAWACSQSLLTPEVAQAVGKEAQVRGIAATQLVVEKGLMDAVQVDIVETLLRPDEVIPNYEILSLIGRGGMGIVYRARQKNLDRVVAIKTVLLSLLSKSGTVARFEQEAMTVGRLRHPNIVTAYDFGRHSGRLFFVMELLEGETLEAMIGRLGRLDEPLAWGLIRQAAAGLAHAAEANIIHRDIKPANLILVEAPAGLSLAGGLPMVKITDFGLALLAGQSPPTGRLTMAGTTLGTPMYMAPEQVSDSEVDCRADIYSLGATAFHLLAGQPPFGDKNHWEVLSEKSKGTLPSFDRLPSSVSAASVELIRDMMAADPSKRVADYQELLGRIDSLTGTRLPAAGSRARLLDRRTRTLAKLFSKLRSSWLVGRISSRQWPNLRLVFVTAIVLLLPAALFAIWHFWLRGSAATPTKPTLIASGREVQLFEGTSLRGWVPLEGVWAPTKDAEGGLVLSGRGMVRRPLPSLESYRIMLGLDLQKADAVEIHFGFEAPDAKGQPRKILRVSRQGIVLGRGNADRDTLQELSPALAYGRVEADAGPVYKEVRLERQGGEWLAFYDGKRVGSVSHSGTAEFAELRLVTESGPAFFDALAVEELVEPAN
jgi:eukaryotic-like serine/threonine-protein kinase